MSIFKRLRDISLAAVNDVIDRAEDPVKMLNQYLRDMEDDIADAEISVAKQIAIEKKFKHQYEESQEMVEKRAEQAIKALDAGNEDLARRALQDKKEHKAKADELLTTHENAKANADQLRKQLSEMKDEFDKMKNKKDLLIARAESAKAQKSINQAMSGFGKDTGAKGFDRMNDKVMQMEAEAEASNDLRNSNRSLDDELDSLGKDDVEDELAQLKAQREAKKKQE
jgi:phage shock protein A